MYSSAIIIALLITIVGLVRFYLITRVLTTATQATPSQSNRLTKYDYAIMLVATLAYGGFSFQNIGSHQQNPVWYGDSTSKEINLIFAKPTKISQIKLDGCFDKDSLAKVYGLNKQNKTINFATSNNMSRINCSLLGLQNQESQQLIQQIKIHIVTPTMIVYKVMVYDDKNTAIHNYLYAYDHDQNLDNADGIFAVPESASKMTITTNYGKMIFDERYYALNAYHYLHGNNIAINSAHPQLAILINSLGIKIFGMNPFGWRFMPNLFGILLLPLIFLFTRRLFNKTSIATLAMLFVGIDFMHFAISRLALLESSVTFFIMASYYFMWCYLQLRKTSPKQSYSALLYTGISMGIAMSCKWSGGFMLPMLVLAIVIIEYHQQKTWRNYALIISSIIIIPSLIYLASYIPYIMMNKLNFWDSFSKLQEYAFITQSKLMINSTNFATSKWWQWPLGLSTLLVDSTLNIFTAKAYSLVLMGNPLLYWASIPAFLATIICIVKTRNRGLIFLSIAIICQYLPYIFAKRVEYLYYYYTISILVFITVAYAIHQLWLLRGISKFYPFIAISYVALAILAFIAYYPVYAGTITDFSYLYRDLSLISSWKLVIPPNL